MNESNENSKAGENLRITVQLLANLRTYAATEEECFPLTVANQETVATFLDRFGFPPTLKPIVVVNGRPAKPTTQLSNDDHVLVFEPVTGG